MNIFKKLIRTILHVKQDETIRDAIDRHKSHISQLFSKQKFNKEDFEHAIREVGISTNDTIMVLCAWRQFYNFQGNPDDIIDVLLSVVGNGGTIIMPSYGPDMEHLDIQNTPSKAGVLSETFRKRKDVRRSLCSHFTISVLGPNADMFIQQHDKSKYGFDEYSPCSILSKMDMTKILFLGLGKIPAKVPLFHAAVYKYMTEKNEANRIINRQYIATIISEGEIKKKQMIARDPYYANNNKAFRNVIKRTKSFRTIAVSNLWVSSANCKDAFDNAMIFLKNGNCLYKHQNRK